MNALETVEVLDPKSDEQREFANKASAEFNDLLKSVSAQIDEYANKYPTVSVAEGVDLRIIKCGMASDIKNQVDASSLSYIQLCILTDVVRDMSRASDKKTPA